MRRAFTLVELAVILVIIGILCAVGVPWALKRVDRSHVRGARAELVSAIAAARAAAVTSGRHVAVRFDAGGGRVLVTSGTDTILLRRLAAVHGVSVESNRDSMAYDPSGLGYGAANQTVVVSRGAAADTIVVSRLGRVR
jgi:Tfp pilus assembly protein FimT